MALRRNSIKGSGLTKLRSIVTSSDGGASATETQTWTGPYDQLKTKQQSVVLSAKATDLRPTEVDHGILTITFEVATIPTGSGTTPISIVDEVVWQELRKPVATNPFFKDLTKWKIKEMRNLADSDNSSTLETDPVALKLLDFLLEGTTEWSTGVPVVRRITTRRAGQTGNGKAWFRDDPPVAVEGSWQWLKTADERRKEGTVYTQTEEWTGAEEWDADLYPPGGS